MSGRGPCQRTLYFTFLATPMFSNIMAMAVNFSQQLWQSWILRIWACAANFRIILRIAPILTILQRFSLFVSIFLLCLHRNGSCLIPDYHSDISVRFSDLDCLWKLDIFQSINVCSIFAWLKFQKFVMCVQIRESSSSQLSVIDFHISVLWAVV